MMHVEQTHRKSTNDESLRIVAKGIRNLMRTDPDAYAPEIGAMVGRAVCCCGGYPEKTLELLAKLTDMPVRTLVCYHKAHFVVRIAGNRLPALLFEGVSFDAYRQLSRILHADEDLAWMKATILQTAENGLGIPNYMLGGLIDKALAGHRVYDCRLDVRLRYDWLERLTSMLEGEPLRLSVAA